MATPGRTLDSSLAAAAIRELMEDEPFRVRFFQAVRLMERLAADREMVGRFVHPKSEAVHFSARQSISFPASEVHSTEWPEGKPPKMVVNFMGLTGPVGVLPIYYTEMIMHRALAKDRAVGEFFDIFNHRVISLFYRAWEKYRFTLPYERGEPDQMSQMLKDLIGIGTAGLQDRQDVLDDSLVFYSGLLAQHPRSALGLEQIIADYFDVPVEIEQFAGAWFKLDKKTQTCFQDGDTESECLGGGAVVGDEIWDHQSVVRICIGPLPLERYLEFLPTGSAYAPLRALVHFYFNDELDFELQLVLERDHTPQCELGAEGDESPQLGWVTWMKTKPLGRDPADTVTKL